MTLEFPWYSTGSRPPSPLSRWLPSASFSGSLSAARTAWPKWPNLITSHRWQCWNVSGLYIYIIYTRMCIYICTCIHTYTIISITCLTRLCTKCTVWILVWHRNALLFPPSLPTPLWLSLAEINAKVKRQAPRSGKHLPFAWLNPTVSGKTMVSISTMPKNMWFKCPPQLHSGKQTWLAGKITT